MANEPDYPSRVRRLFSDTEHTGPFVVVTREQAPSGGLYDVDVFGPFADRIEAIRFGGELFNQTGRVWRAAPLASPKGGDT